MYEPLIFSKNKKISINCFNLYKIMKANSSFYLTDYLTGQTSYSNQQICINFYFDDLQTIPFKFRSFLYFCGQFVFLWKWKWHLPQGVINSPQSHHWVLHLLNILTISRPRWGSNWWPFACGGKDYLKFTVLIWNYLWSVW